MTRNDDENVAYAGQTLPEIRTGDQVGWKLNAGQITNILAILHHRLQQVELNHTTKADVAARTSELQRQRRSPGTGADNRNRLGGLATY